MTNDTNSMINKSLNVDALSPIVLFVYNRPRHTRQAMEALRNNELAKDSQLFVFSDGPRSDDDKKTVQQVREYIKSVEGFKNVTLFERDRNVGLAQSIISGVTDIVNQFGKIIVLEDDLITSQYFLSYMNQALELYQNETRVMHISGSIYPIDTFPSEETFFLRIPLCWGWGTWKRAWDLFEKKFEILEKFDRPMKEMFDFDGTYPYWKQLEMNHKRQLSTWFVFWYATVFLKNGLALFPKESLVKNIGHDGSGIHCGRSDAYDVEISLHHIEVLPIPVQESIEAFMMHKKYFRTINLGYHRRIVNKIIHMTKRYFCD